MLKARLRVTLILVSLIVSVLFAQATAREVQMHEKAKYGGWPNCLRLTNGKVELIVTTDVGPRIIRFGFVGGQNVFKEFKDQLGKTGGDEWRSYGGHRLWHAPEDAKRTYWPDNTPVQYSWDGKSVKLTQSIEQTTGIVKEIEITLDPNDNHVTVVHRLTNKGLWDIELAPWSLTVMAENGRAVFPQEPFRPHPQFLLPARPLVLWGYTDMKDPRWTWGTKYIQLKQDPKATTKQKVGIMNTLGWAAYALNGDVFVKRFNYDSTATYPDFGCNMETYTDPDILEIETLGSLKKLAANASVEHVEHWFLYHAQIGDSESEIDRVLLPLIHQSDQYRNR
jgi:hypothetical protein